MFGQYALRCCWAVGHKWRWKTGSIRNNLYSSNIVRSTTLIVQDAGVVDNGVDMTDAFLASQVLSEES